MVDILIVSTKKILLYSGNSYEALFSPPIFTMVGKISKVLRFSLKKDIFIGQSAGNFRKFTTAKAQYKNAYSVYSNLPEISDHISNRKIKNNLNDQDFGYFLAGLIEGDGWFGYKELHIVFHESDITLAY